MMMAEGECVLPTASTGLRSTYGVRSNGQERAFTINLGMGTYLLEEVADGIGRDDRCDGPIPAL